MVWQKFNLFFFCQYRYISLLLCKLWISLVLEFNWVVRFQVFLHCCNICVNTNSWYIYVVNNDWWLFKGLKLRYVVKWINKKLLMGVCFGLYMDLLVYMSLAYKTVDGKNFNMSLLMFLTGIWGIKISFYDRLGTIPKK